MIVTMQDYTITDRAPVLIGYEGENLSRNFTVKTFDDLSAIASIELLIGDVNCGAMTVNNTDDTEITISLDAFMIGRAGYKKAQLIMLDDTGAVIMKSAQFDVLVGASNNPRYYAAGEKVKTLTVNIDGRTRQIILPAGFAVSVNGDVAVDHIAFKAPASYGDFDFGAAACRVDWTGVDGTHHTNICTEKDADGNWIWALPTALTRGGEGEISFSVSYIVTDATTGAVTADWNTGLVKFYHLESAKSDDAEEDVEDETTYDRLASAIAAVQSAQASVDDVNAILAGITSATPTVVETVADLNGLDTSKVKLAIVAADGYLHYYDGTAWKSGFAYGGLQEVIAARTDSDGVTHADLKTRLNTAEAQIKEDLSAFQTATSDDVGKALKAKTVANGKVTEWEFGATGDKNAVPLPVDPESKYGVSGQVLETLGDGKTRWRDVDAVDPEVIEGAVTDWLDEHPEATTTVPDNSLTEAKFTEATQLKVLNDYVTPEMFGAKGDGTTDDTQAIKDMFASNADKYVFLHDLYKVTGGIDVTRPNCIVDFGDKTEFTLTRNNGLRDFDYVICFKAGGITTKGYLHVNANFSVNVGIFLSQCAGSNFDHLSVNYARVWGICTDIAHYNLGSMTFNNIEATACGYKVNAKGLSSGDYTTITDIQIHDLSDDAIRSIFEYAKWVSPHFLIDDSNFQDKFDDTGSRMAFEATSPAGIVLDENDVTRGTFAFKITGYVDDEDASMGRDIFLPLGGGVFLHPHGSEGLTRIRRISTMRCPVGLVFDMPYGGVIGHIVSQYDTVVMYSNSLALFIEYMYTEGVGTGFKITDKYNRIYLIARNDNPRIFVANPFIGAGRIPFLQENEIIVGQERIVGYDTRGSLWCPDYLAMTKLNSINVDGPTSNLNTVIDEYSARNYTAWVPGFYRSDTITLNLKDLHAQRRNRFEPFRFYAGLKRDDFNYDNLGIKLSTALVNAGYSIHGAVNNVLYVHPSNYGKFFVVTIVLFGKTFYVTAEPVTFVDNTQTEGT